MLLNNQIHPIDKYIFYPILILPFAIVTGPFLSDLIISMVSIIFLIRTFILNNFAFFKNKFFISFFLFSIYLIIGSLISSHTLSSLESSLFYIRFTFFSLAVWMFLETYNQFSKYFFLSLLITMLIVMFDAYFQLILGYNILGFSKPDHRLSSFFNTEHIVGSFFVRLLPLLIGLYIINFEIKKKYLILLSIIIILISGIIYSSGERTAFGLLIIFLLLMSFVPYVGKISRYIIFISSALIILISIFNPITKDRIFVQTYNEFGFDEFFQNKDKGIRVFTALHEKHFNISIEMFKDSPIIGQGTKTFRILCKSDQFNKNDNLSGCSTHTHNVFLQLLSETGLIGFIFYFSIWLLSLYIFFKVIILNHFDKIKKYKSITDLKNVIGFLIVLSSVIINLFPFAPSNNFFNNFINIIYFLPIGFVLHLYKQNLKKI